MIPLGIGPSRRLGRNYRMSDCVVPRGPMRWRGSGITSLAATGLTPLWGYYFPALRPGGLIPDLCGRADLRPCSEYLAAGLPLNVRQHAFGVIAGSVETTGSRAVYSTRTRAARIELPPNFLVHLRLFANSDLSGSSGRTIFDLLTEISNPSYATPAVRVWFKSSFDLFSYWYNSTGGVQESGWNEGAEGLVAGNYYDFFLMSGTNGSNNKFSKLKGSRGAVPAFSDSNFTTSGSDGTIGYPDRVAFPHSVALYNASAGYRCTSDITYCWAAMYKFNFRGTWSQAVLESLCDLEVQVQAEPKRTYIDMGSAAAAVAAWFHRSNWRVR